MREELLKRDATLGPILEKLGKGRDGILEFGPERGDRAEGGPRGPREGKGEGKGPREAKGEGKGPRDGKGPRGPKPEEPAPQPEPGA